MRKAAILVLSVVALLVLAGCAAGPNTAVDPTAAGFWLGLWHGFIFPVTFALSVLTDTVSMYEVRNNGAWYDFGYFLGICGFLVVFGVVPSRRR